MASHLHHEARRSSTDDIDAKDILEMNAAGNPQAAYEIFLTNERGRLSQAAIDHIMKKAERCCAEDEPNRPTLRPTGREAFTMRKTLTGKAEEQIRRLRRGEIEAEASTELISSRGHRLLVLVVSARLKELCMDLCHNSIGLVAKGL